MYHPLRLQRVPRLFRAQQNVNVRDMDRLVSYPFVVVRIACGPCQRTGSFRLARLAAKYGAEIRMDELLLRLTADCPAQADGRCCRHPYRAKSGCLARFVDLDGPTRPPDAPPAFGGCVS